MTPQKTKRRFKDSHGHIGTPLGISNGCVVFMREGYPHLSYANIAERYHDGSLYWMAANWTYSGNG